ncbi:hypothetical protein BGX24_004334 [Mortierella sp. AD032]|nr:hypothetical protein BGX24_004334 [Mortierella sp. AD032]
MDSITPLTHTGSGTGKTVAVDTSFFEPTRKTTYLPRVTGKTAIDISQGMQRVQMFPHQHRTDDQGGYVSRKERMQGVRDGLLDMGVENVSGALGNKKHKKGKKNIKQRSGAGIF